MRRGRKARPRRFRGRAGMTQPSRRYERALLEEERDRDEELRELERRDEDRVEPDRPELERPELDRPELDRAELERRDVEPVRFRGTLAPFSRASDKPIAIACFRLVTVPPCPDFPRFSVPCFFRRIALSTDLEADSP